MGFNLKAGVLSAVLNAKRDGPAIAPDNKKKPDFIKSLLEYALIPLVIFVMVYFFVNATIKVYVSNILKNNA